MNQAAVVPAGNKCEGNAHRFILFLAFFFFSLSQLSIFSQSSQAFEYCKSLDHMLWNTNKISCSSREKCRVYACSETLGFLNDLAKSSVIENMSMN